MRKFTKILTAVMSAAAIAVSEVTPMVSAEEKYPTGALPEPGKDFYTLSQLFEMNDEDFLALSGRMGDGQVYYNVIEYGVNDQYLADYVRDLSGSLSIYVSDKDSAYVEDETEAIVRSALEDTVKYTINSPTFEDDMYYSHIFQIVFPDYYISAENNTISDKQIMEFAKCWFCVDQVFEISYDGFDSDSVLPEPSSEPTEATEETINWLLPIWEKVTLKGDADLDGIVSLSDVIAVSKYSLSHNLYPLKNDVAYVNADMNQDGDINAVDTSALIEINLGKKSG